MKKIISFILIFFILSASFGVFAVSPLESVTKTYSAFDGFSQYQGKNLWSYEFLYNGEYRQLQNYQINSRAWYASDDWDCGVSADTISPGKNMDAVLKFTAPSDGVIRITNNIKAPNGDGVFASVLKGKTLYWREILPLNEVKEKILRFEVKKNDEVRFIVGKNEDIAYAPTRWTPVIDYITGADIELSEPAEKETEDFLENPQNNTEPTIAEALIAKLGIMDGVLFEKTKITRGEMAAIVCKMLKLEVKDYNHKFDDTPPDSEYFAEISTVAEYGYMRGYGNGLFGAYDFVSMEQAAAVMTNCNGHGAIAKSKGGSALNYLDAAQSAGILNGVSGNVIDGRIMSVIVYNTLNSQYMDMKITGAYTEYYKREALLEMVWQLSKIKGNVEQTRYTSLNYAAALSDKNTLTINGEKYNAAEDFSQSLGYSVEAYIFDIDDFREIKYLFHRADNKKTAIKGEDINLSKTTAQNICFLENDREKNIKISGSAKIIKNGRFSGVSLSDSIDFSDKDGLLTLVDNNNDGVYDVIFIDSYKSGVVRSASIGGGKIYLKYDMAYIDLENINTKYLIYKNNERQDVKNPPINPDDCISWSVSDDGLIFRIFLNSDGVFDMITAVDHENIYFGEYGYTLSKQYDALVKSNQIKKLEAGMFVYAHVNHLNKIVSYTIKENNKITVFIIKMSKSSGLDAVVKARVLNTEGVVNDFTLNEKIIYNNNNTSAASVYDIDKTLYATNYGKISNQIARITIDMYGNISSIETPNMSGDNSGLSFVTAEGWLECQPEYIISYYSQINEKCKVFVVPAEYTDNPDSYKAHGREWFTVDRVYNATGIYSQTKGLYEYLVRVYDKDDPDKILYEYIDEERDKSVSTLKLYDLTENKTFNYAVYYYKSADAEAKATPAAVATLVTSIIDVFTARGDTVKAIKGVTEYGAEVKVILKYDWLADGVKAGDIVCFESINDMAVRINKLYSYGSPDDFIHSLNIPSYSSSYTSGTIESIFPDRIFIDIPSHDRKRVLMYTYRDVLVFNQKTKTVKKIKMSDLVIGQKVVAFLEYTHTIRMLAVYE